MLLEQLTLLLSMSQTELIFAKHNYIDFQVQHISIPTYIDIICTYFQLMIIESIIETINLIKKHRFHVLSITRNRYKKKLKL